MISNTYRMLGVLAKRQPKSSVVMVRAFSDCEPVERIRGVFETYRREHFSDETPSRFKKHIIKAVQSPTTINNSSGGKPQDVVQIENLNLILENIGRADAKLSSEDENILLREAGVFTGSDESSRSIPVSKILQMF